jgi:hypothetical protein
VTATNTAGHREPAATLQRAAHWTCAAAIALYLVTVGFNSLARTRLLTPDSMNYIDVARNILAGRGLVQSTVGFNQPHFSVEAPSSAPLSAQPPLYPLLIAALGLFGIDPLNAAPLISIVAYSLVILLGYTLARELFDEDVALLSGFCLVFYFPMRITGRNAWSDALNAAIMLVALWLLVRRPRTILTCATAGVAAGLSFATRYAMAPLFCVGALFLFLQPGRKERLRSLIPFSLAFAAVTSLVLVRNLRVLRALSPPANPSQDNLATNAATALRALFGAWMFEDSANYQMLLAGLAVLGLGLILLRQHRLRPVCHYVCLVGQRYLLILWAAAYIGSLIYQRTRTHFDEIDARLVLPAGVALIIPTAAVLLQVFPPLRPAIVYIGTALILVLTSVEVHVAVATPQWTPERAIADSERLSWIARSTTPRDLIIGIDTVDVPFYFRYPVAISFSPFPYTDYAHYDTIIDYCRRHRADHDRMYFIWQGYGEAGEASLKRAYGPFVTNLVMNRMEDYPGIVFRKQLNDGYVFEIRPP